MASNYFPQRIPEPEEMEEMEHRAFEYLSKQNYKRWILPIVDTITKNYNAKDAKILDIGSGPGLLVKMLAEKSNKFEMVGLDISEEALSLARKNTTGLENVTFRQGRASNLPFPDKTFDIVISKDSLHHFENAKKAIKEMARVAKPGGLLYIQDLRRNLPKYLLQHAIPPDNTIKKLQYYSARASYTKEEVQEILNDLPLKKIKVRTPHLTKKLRKKYKKQGIDLQKLKEGLQARYIATARKPSH